MRKKNRGFLVSGKSFKNTCNKVNIIVKNDIKIIKGVVTIAKGIPAARATIEIVQINKNNNERLTLGYVYTNNNGEYAFCIIPSKDKFYEIIVYTPIKNSF